MRFRLGFVLGFGSGYYLGAMAGRERYEQINRKLRELRRSDAYEAATDAARDAAATGVDKARDLADSATGNGDEPGYGTTPYTRPGTEH